MACQRWQSLTFLHWPYDPAEIQRLLPAGLSVEASDGAAWVGLTPFVLVGFRPLCLPAVPVISTFPETNVRTYVRDDDGRDGLWFLSLDVSRLAMALGARGVLWAPYHWASMSVDEGPVVRYRSRRRSAGGGSHDIAVRPGLAVGHDRPPLVDFLTGRWRAFTRVAGRLVTIPVEHEPWPLFDADLLQCDQDLLDAAGLPSPGEQPLVHFSPGVDVRLGIPDR
jgi:uncharacterized protein YqjF (DUF2071 family)